MGRKSPKYVKSIKELVPESTLNDWKEERDSEIQRKIVEIKPLNKNQEKYINSILTSVITIAFGPPGTGRTMVSCGIACKLLLEDKIDKIILCRPAVECGEKLGALPGTKDEKIINYLMPFLDYLDLFLGEKLVNKYIKEKKIILAAVGFLRGSSFKNSIVLVDEAENMTYQQLFMILTRIGENCRMVINGDPKQSDLIHNKHDFMNIVNKLESLRNEISIIEFSKNDIVRSSIVKKIVELLG